MMLSSISYIAAVAAIAGSTIAAPAPFYARALEQVNLFERDLDVYPRESWVARGEPVDLFTRSLDRLPYQKDHTNAASELQHSANLNQQAAIAAYAVDNMKAYHKHTTHVTTLMEAKVQNENAARAPYNKQKHEDVGLHLTYAQTTAAYAKETINNGGHNSH